MAKSTPRVFWDQSMSLNRYLAMIRVTNYVIIQEPQN